MKVPTEKAVKTYADAADALKANDNEVVKRAVDQEINSEKTFSKLQIFNHNVIQAWGKDGILRRPAIISGTSLLIHRNDATITNHGYEDEWVLTGTLVLPTCFLPGSTVRLYFQTYAADATGSLDDVQYRFKVDGVVQYSSGTYDSDGWYERIFDNISVNPGSVITTEMRHVETAGDCSGRYLRCYVSTPGSLTAWERQYLGFTG